MAPSCLERLHVYPPEHDEPTHCEVCHAHTDVCECPECPVCTEVGLLDCYGSHVGALPERFTYTVIWDNGNACDELGVFDTHDAAKCYGEDWLSEMVAIDRNPEEAAEAYSYEVKEPEPAPPWPGDIRAAHTKTEED